MLTTGAAGPDVTDRPSGTGDTALALLRSASAALVSVGLPLVMGRLLDADRFAVWTIALQAFVYGAFLEAGITLAVSRTAAARQRVPDSPVSLVLRAGRAVSRVPLAVAVAGYVVLVLVLPTLYSNIPSTLLTQGRIAVAIMASGSVVTLRSLPAQGYLQGVGRFAAVTVPVAVSTAAAALGALVIAALDAPVWLMAALFSSLRAVGALSVERAALAHADSLGSSPTPAGALVDLTRELRATVGTLWIWSFAGFLGSGLDLTIVSWADYPSVRPYAIGAALTAALTGVAGALVTVVVPRVARSDRAAPDHGSDPTSRQARLAAWVISCTALPLVAAAAPVSTALHGNPAITLALLAGAWLRLSMTPFVAAMVGSGDHRLLRRSPLIEGFANVGLGLVLAPRVGAIGVALATLVSGAFGVGMHVFRNLPRSSVGTTAPWSLVRRVHVPAAIAFCAAGALGSSDAGLARSILVTAGVSVLGAAALLLASTDRSDRTWIRAVALARSTDGPTSTRAT